MTYARVLYDELIHKSDELTTEDFEKIAETLRPEMGIEWDSDEYAILNRIGQADAYREKWGKDPLPVFDDNDPELNRRITAFALIGSGIDHYRSFASERAAFEQRNGLNTEQSIMFVQKLNDIFMHEFSKPEIKVDISEDFLENGHRVMKQDNIVLLPVKTSAFKIDLSLNN